MAMISGSIMANGDGPHNILKKKKEKTLKE
jgi:hypothetical protein